MSFSTIHNGKKIKPGDYVYATDETTGKTALKEVKQVFRNETDEWIHVTVNGEEIICTPGHPFYSPVKGWTSACQLRAGDILVNLNGEYVIVELVQHELLESPERSYNFEVEGFHTYYVGSKEVLVHNKCDKIETGQTKDYSVHESRRAAYRAAKRDAGVVSQQPSSVGPAYNKQGHWIVGKTYVFGDKEILWHSAGHPEYGMSRHFNYNGHHYFY